MGIVEDDVVVGCWQVGAADGTIVWRINGLDDAGGGWKWAGINLPVCTEWARATKLTVGAGSSGGNIAGLHLCELLVWDDMLSEGIRGSLRSYLHRKWGCYHHHHCGR